MDKMPSKEEFAKWMRKTEEADREIRQTLSSVDKYRTAIEKEGSYPYIAFHDPFALYELFSKILEMPLNTRRFVDIGCGTGRIVNLAQACGIPAKGLEYHEPYTKLGREIFGLADEDITVGNAFDITSDFLHDFEFIYTYMPLFNGEKMTKLHTHLYEKAHYGTILVEMLPRYYPMSKFYGTKNAVDLWDRVPFAAVRKSYYEDDED